MPVVGDVSDTSINHIVFNFLMFFLYIFLKGQFFPDYIFVL